MFTVILWNSGYAPELTPSLDNGLIRPLKVEICQKKTRRDQENYNELHHKLILMVGYPKKESKN